MAVDENKKISSSEPEGPIESILSYLKERIESPFLMSFLFSWCIFNRDFLFYFYLSSDHYDYRMLANWDYSFWSPLLAGALLTLLFSGASSLLSAGRYFVLKKCIVYTKTQKDGFDSAYEIRLQEIKLKELKEQVDDLMIEAHSWQEKNNLYKADFERNKDPHLALSRGQLFDFLMESAKFNVLFRTNHFSEIDGFKASSILPNSVIKVSFVDKKDSERKIPQFEGTAFEFISNNDYFDWNDKDSINQLFSLLTTLELNRFIVLDLNIGRVDCFLVSAEEFK